MATQDKDFVTKVRNASRALLDAHDEMLALQSIWNARVYGTELDEQEALDQGVTGAELGSALFASTDALELVLTGAIKANYEKIT